MRLLLSLMGFIANCLYNNHIPVRYENYIMYMSSNVESIIDSYLEEHNSSITEMAKRYRRIDRPDEGYDRHAPDDDPDASSELLRKLIENNEKMKVLRSLENTRTSLNVRRQIAEQYIRNDSESPLVLNITAGGLWDDWNFSITI